MPKSLPKVSSTGSTRGNLQHWKIIYRSAYNTNSSLPFNCHPDKTKEEGDRQPIPCLFNPTVQFQSLIIDENSSCSNSSTTSIPSALSLSCSRRFSTAYSRDDAFGLCVRIVNPQYEILHYERMYNIVLGSTKPYAATRFDEICLAQSFQTGPIASKFVVLECHVIKLHCIL